MNMVEGSKLNTYVLSDRSTRVLPRLQHSLDLPFDLLQLLLSGLVLNPVEMPNH